VPLPSTIQWYAPLSPIAHSCVSRVAVTRSVSGYATAIAERDEVTPLTWPNASDWPVRSRNPDP